VGVGNLGCADDEVGMCVYVVVIDVDHVRFLHECFIFMKG